MSETFTTAILLTSIGATGAAITATAEVIRSWRSSHNVSRKHGRRDTIITFRVGPDQLKLKSASTADAVRALESWLVDHEAETLPSDEARSPDTKQ